MYESLPNIFDPKYEGLDSKEAIRQVERDRLLARQTIALEEQNRLLRQRGTSNTNYNYATYDVDWGSTARWFGVLLWLTLGLYSLMIITEGMTESYTTLIFTLGVPVLYTVLVEIRLFIKRKNTKKPNKRK